METKSIEEKAESAVRDHPDYKASGLDEYMNGYFNGFITGYKADREDVVRVIEAEISKTNADIAINGQILDHPLRMNDQSLFIEINELKFYLNKLNKLLTHLNLNS